MLQYLLECVTSAGASHFFKTVHNPFDPHACSSEHREHEVSLAQIAPTKVSAAKHRQAGGVRRENRLGEVCRPRAVPLGRSQPTLCISLAGLVHTPFHRST